MERLYFESQCRFLKNTIVLLLLLFFVFLLWVGQDRHKMQKQILKLEREVQECVLSRDLAQYRVQHPFK